MYVGYVGDNGGGVCVCVRERIRIQNVYVHHDACMVLDFIS